MGHSTRLLAICVGHLHLHIPTSPFLGGGRPTTTKHSAKAVDPWPKRTPTPTVAHLASF